MLAIQNPFYKNPEANARQLLQQQMMSDSQKGFQQSLVELMAIRPLLSQGQLCFCVPIGPGPFSFGMIPPTQITLQLPQQDIPTTPPHLPPPQPHPKEHVSHHGESSREPQVTKETKLHVSYKNDHAKSTTAPRQDKCKFRCDSVEIILDLKGLLPADISVNVDELCIRIEVTRVDKDGTKSYWRQYDLPASVICELTRCVLSHDGYLHITAPWQAME